MALAKAAAAWLWAWSARSETGPDGGWCSLGGEPGPPIVETRAPDAATVELRVEWPGVWRETVRWAGADYARATWPGAEHAGVGGRPDVPVLALPLWLPEAGLPVAEVLSEESVEWDWGPYLPAPEETRRAAPSAPPRFVFGAAYRRDAFDPPAALALGEPFWLRHARGAVLRLYPVRHHPLRRATAVARRLTLRVRTSGASMPQALATPAPAAECREFVELYRRLFVNGLPPRWETGLVEAGSLLIVCPDAFAEAVAPLARWKRQRGLPTRVARLSEIGNTASQILACIRAEYETNALAFVQLVGDERLLPAPAGTKGNMVGKPSDARYGLLAGNDLYPDAIVARFCAGSAQQVSNMVWRSIRYEGAPHLEGAWYRRACGAASTQPGDVEQAERLRTLLTNGTYELVDAIYPPQSSASNLVSALNAGRGLANLIGHGNAYLWSWTSRFDPQFNTGDAYRLKNAERLPFVLLVGCASGNYTVTNDCLAEALLKAGSAAAPCGAIAVQASLTDEWIVPPLTAQTQTIGDLVSNRYQTVGALALSGVLKALAVHTEANPEPPGTKGEELCEQLHLFGDGALMLRTDTPRLLTAQHAGVMVAGAATYAVRVAGGKGARGALYDAARDRLVGAAYADAQGVARIPAAGAEPGLLTLTVTAPNRAPLVEEVLVVPPARAVLLVR